MHACRKESPLESCILLSVSEAQLFSCSIFSPEVSSMAQSGVALQYHMLKSSSKALIAKV